eukprot:scaffold52616_cov20-Tisochrysis_lutea.AAC.2
MTLRLVGSPHAKTQVLFAIDDYNALGHNAPTGYGAWEGADPELGGAGAAAQEGRLVRRQLRVSELTLVSIVSVVAAARNALVIFCALSMRQGLRVMSGSNLMRVQPCPPRVQARALRLLGCSSRVNHAAVLCATSSTAAPPMHKPQPEVLIKQGIRRDQWPRFHKVGATEMGTRAE